ncbi:hypothetical protein EVAR_24572_1 [Eumeta japonica]|uniref:Uncharacterized protein n=1 Tax=Eumeta variegata TaxID=151549 RepID=A0A4C1W7Q0_EUMVA|nr:hypothetical protein EVAR_24572_1 [Eumeta japonica]
MRVSVAHSSLYHSILPSVGVFSPPSDVLIIPAVNTFVDSSEVANVHGRRFPPTYSLLARILTCLSNILQNNNYNSHYGGVLTSDTNAAYNSGLPFLEILFPDSDPCPILDSDAHPLSIPILISLSISIISYSDYTLRGLTCVQ